MPLTESGKIARERLPPPADIRGSGKALRSDGSEPVVRRVFEKLLGATNVGPHDDFFALGGHSLLAARAAAELARALRVEVNIHDLFRFARVTDLALALDARVPRPRPETARKVARDSARAARVVLDDFSGFHVNCFVHCLVQSLNYFEARPLHELNDVAAAFLSYRCEHRDLNPVAVPTATLFREIVCQPISGIEERLGTVLGVRTTRVKLEDGREPLQEALRCGYFPILIGGTERVVEPSLALLDCNDEAGHFVAARNDFGGGLVNVPFDSPRVRSGQEVLVVHPPSRPRDEGDAWLLHAFRTHVRDRTNLEASDGEAFARWLDKYATRSVLPEHPVLCKELEGVNVAIGSELGGFLRFERHVLVRLRPLAEARSLEAYAELVERTLSDYQHLANVLRRGLIDAENHSAAALNGKIVESLAIVIERQRSLRTALAKLA
jgi:hypothetical protein